LVDETKRPREKTTELLEHIIIAEKTKHSKFCKYMETLWAMFQNV
jgi:hypothetical protein